MREPHGRTAVDFALFDQLRGRTGAGLADSPGDGQVMSAAAGIRPGDHLAPVGNLQRVGPQPKFQRLGQLGSIRSDHLIDSVGIIAAGRFGPGRHRPDGSVDHPLSQRRDFGILQPGLGRHLLVTPCRDTFQQKTGPRLTGFDRLSRLAATEQPLPLIDPQSPLLLLGSVTRAATGEQQRTNLRLEELGLLRINFPDIRFFVGRRDRRSAGRTRQYPRQHRGGDRGSSRHHWWIPSGRSVHIKSHLDDASIYQRPEPPENNAPPCTHRPNSPAARS